MLDATGDFPKVFNIKACGLFIAYSEKVSWIAWFNVLKTGM